MQIRLLNLQKYGRTRVCGDLLPARDYVLGNLVEIP
jgi:hypothetical protein